MVVKDENFTWMTTEEKREGFVDTKVAIHNADEEAHPALAQEMRDALKSHSENQDENGARHVTAQDVDVWNKAASDSSDALEAAERYREQAENRVAALSNSILKLQAGLDAAKARELNYGDENIVPTDPSFFTYVDKGDGMCAISGITEGCPTDIVVPYEIDGMVVVEVGPSAFYDGQMRSVIMPDTVRGIGSEAFYGCSNLMQVRLSNHLERIGDNAFVATSSLHTLTIPDSVTSMGYYVFMDFGDGYGVTILCNKGSYAETYAIDYDIPYEYIDAKDYADAVVADPISKTNALYYYDDISAVPTDPSFLYCIEWGYGDDGEVLCAITGDVDDAITDVVLPYEINGMKVTHIFDFAFSGSKLRSVIMPNTITSISVNTFNYCSNLSCVRLSSKLESIYDNAFVELPNLHTLVIPDSVVSIGNGSFAECPNLTIMCHKGSCAEAYAKENNIPYAYLDAKDYIGDMGIATPDWEDINNKPFIENGEGVGSLVGAVPESLIEDETDFANTATADNAVTFGKSNKNSGKRSIMAGKLNTNSGANSIVTGLSNNNESTHSIVGGGNNIVSKGSMGSLVVGERHNVNAIFNMVGGTTNTVNGIGNITGGSNNQNNSDYGLVGGLDNHNTGGKSLMVGTSNDNSGAHCIVGGSNNKNSATHGIVTGNNNTIHNNALGCLVTGENQTVGDATDDNNRAPFSMVGGTTNTVHAPFSLVIGGWNTANAERSITCGKHNTNNSDCGIVAGEHNVGRDDTLLELGNGTHNHDTGEVHRSNAFEVYTDGSISLDNGETKLTPEILKRLIALVETLEVEHNDSEET